MILGLGSLAVAHPTNQESITILLTTYLARDLLHLDGMIAIHGRRGYLVVMNIALVRIEFAQSYSKY